MQAQAGILNSKLEKLIADFKRVRQRTEQICEPLHAEDYIPQVVYFASPPKWHLAHTTWFFEEMILKKFLSGYQEFDPEFGFLFNSYYNNIGERTLRADRGNITRPGVNEVYAYRKHVNKHIEELLATQLPQEAEDLITLGLNHEQQHQELLITDLKYAFSGNPTFPVYDPDFLMVGGKNEEEGWTSIVEGIYEVGYKGDGFSFDNELTRHKVYLQEFEISNSLVTNGEFIAFIEAGGYEDFNLWLDEGWSWVNENEISEPLYWHKIDGKWHYYTLAGRKPVDPDAILSHVSFYEASEIGRAHV